VQPPEQVALVREGPQFGKFWPEFPPDFEQICAQIRQICARISSNLLNSTRFALSSLNQPNESVFGRHGRSLCVGGSGRGGGGGAARAGPSLRAIRGTSRPFGPASWRCFLAAWRSLQAEQLERVSRGSLGVPCEPAGSGPHQPSLAAQDKPIRLQFPAVFRREGRTTGRRVDAEWALWAPIELASTDQAHNGRKGEWQQASTRVRPRRPGSP